MENHSPVISSKTKVQNTTLKWLGICLGVVVVAVIAVNVFKVSVNNLLFVGVLLACPLMHFAMMRGGGHKH